MDFTSLFNKQLEEKRRKRDEAKNRSLGSQSQPATEAQTATDADFKAEDQNRNLGSDSKDPASPSTLDDQKAQLLSSINQKKLEESLRLFDKDGGNNELKEDQLRKLQIHVRHEKKDQQYKAYLDRENSVAVQIDLADIAAQNFEKLALQIRRFFKEILQTWTLSRDTQSLESLESREPLDPILQETKKDIVKLLYKLRSGKLPGETLVSLSTIVYYIQTESIVKANEAYLKLSIGNVAWPIGVRDVGIHARAADAKIAGDDKKQLANIMKSEYTRRWLIAVKRIVNYCEKLYEEKKKQAHVSEQ